MNSDDLLVIIDRVKAGSLDEKEIQAIVDAIESKRLVLKESSRSAEIGGDVDGSTITTGNSNTIINIYGRDAKTLDKIVSQYKKEHNKFDLGVSEILNQFIAILKGTWRPFLLGSSGFFIFFLLVIGILRLGQCKFSLECLTHPQGTNLVPSSSPIELFSPKVIPAAKLISAGENRIFGSTKLKGKYKILKQTGIDQFSQGKYNDAYKTFKKLREEASKEKNNNPQYNLPSADYNEALKDPEILIYQNNAEARLRHEKGELIYTIAVAAPISDKDGNIFSVGQQILFGVAQAQNEAFNKPRNRINLEIVIANDLNSADQAGEVAKSLVELRLAEDRRKIRAIVGHYTSPVTCRALKYYDSARLVVISSTSSRTDERKSCGTDRFFRTTTSNLVEARTLANYISDAKKSKISEPKIFAFYKQGEGFSQDLLERFEEELPKRVQILRKINLSNLNEVKEALRSINEANVFAVFPDGKTDDARAYNNALDVIKQSRNIRLILGSNSLYQQEVLGGDNGVQDLEDKLVIAVDWHGKCSNKDFLKAAKETWFGGVNRYTALSYEAVQVLLSSFESDQGKDLLNDLYSVAPKSDVFNDKNISFDAHGDRKDISDRILVTPRKWGDDFFDLLDGESCKF
jgi:ABC-type branched-subunit amino acid transport system substrate-binding protein